MHKPNKYYNIVAGALSFRQDTDTLTDNLVGTSTAGCDLRDGDSAGVGGEDSVLGDHSFELLDDLVLDVDVLEHSLNYTVTFAHLLVLKSW